MSSDPNVTPAPQPPGLWPRIREAVSPFLPVLLRLAVVALAAAVGATLQYFGAPPKVVEKVTEVIKEIPVQGPAPALDEFDGLIDKHGAQGFDAAADAADLAAGPLRTFADTPAGQVADLPKFVFGWKAHEKLLARPPPMKDQNPTGSCVGFGGTTAIERTLAAEILHRGGDPSEFCFFSEEVTYAGAKVQGARAIGMSVSRTDGASGVGAKTWVTQVGGMVPKGKHGKYDLTEYDPARARSWNTSGVPAELVEVAKKYPVKDSVKVVSWQQCKQALASGYGVSVCANWAYTRQRDANGVAQPTSPGWDHCMAIDGYYTDPQTGKEYGHVENSWSNPPDRSGRRTGQAYHTGPTGWGNPTGAGFWASAESLDRALRQGMSYAFSGVTGFPAKKLPIDWFVDAPKPAPQLVPIIRIVRRDVPLTGYAIVSYEPGFVETRDPPAEAVELYRSSMRSHALAW